MANRKRAEVREAVHRRIRRKVRGTTERPRLAVYRSLNHIYAQLIDDEQGRTLAAASSTEKGLRGSTGGNVDAAKRVGHAIAERALSAGVSNVVFDRGGYLYHGRVKAFTDAVREAGVNKDELKRAEQRDAAAKEAAPPEASGKPEKVAKKEKAKQDKGAKPEKADKQEASSQQESQ
jgi:large subunit ribosomal protein L18